MVRLLCAGAAARPLRAAGDTRLRAPDRPRPVSARFAAGPGVFRPCPLRVLANQPVRGADPSATSAAHCGSWQKRARIAPQEDDPLCRRQRTILSVRTFLLETRGYRVLAVHIRASRARDPRTLRPRLPRPAPLRSPDAADGRQRTGPPRQATPPGPPRDDRLRHGQRLRPRSLRRCLPAQRRLLACRNDRAHPRSRSPQARSQKSSSSSSHPPHSSRSFMRRSVVSAARETEIRQRTA